MRPAAVFLPLLFALPAMAQEEGFMDPGMMSGVMFNTSFSLNVPMTATDPAGKVAEEDAYRTSLYERTAKECALLLATVAKTCTVTAVNVSTQINSTPGQPDYLYASANVTMDVEIK